MKEYALTLVTSSCWNRSKDTSEILSEDELANDKQIKHYYAYTRQSRELVSNRAKLFLWFNLIRISQKYNYVYRFNTDLTKSIARWALYMCIKAGIWMANFKCTAPGMRPTVRIKLWEPLTCTNDKQAYTSIIVLALLTSQCDCTLI